LFRNQGDSIDCFGIATPETSPFIIPNPFFIVMLNLFQHLTIKQQTLKRVQGDSIDCFGIATPETSPFVIPNLFRNQGDSSFGFSLVWADPYLVIPNPFFIVMLNLFQHLTIKQQTLKHLPRVPTIGGGGRDSLV